MDTIFSLITFFMFFYVICNLYKNITETDKMISKLIKSGKYKF
jgi:hypothetical protein